MQERSKVPPRYAVVKEGEDLLLKVATQIKARGPGQVLILGRGVGRYFGNKELIPSVLGNDWTILVPPFAPTWEQNQNGIIEFSNLIQENAYPPRVGIFIAPPEFVSEHLFLPSKTGPYAASIYHVGLSDTPLTDMETFRSILSRAHIQSPWVECFFSTDDNKLRPSEQRELNEALLARTPLNEVVPRILRNLQEEVAALEARRFAGAAKKVTKKPWQFWR